MIKHCGCDKQVGEHLSSKSTKPKLAGHSHAVSEVIHFVYRMTLPFRRSSDSRVSYNYKRMPVTAANEICSMWLETKGAHNDS